MNTNKLKPFAQKARQLLMQGVEKRIRYWGFDEQGNVTEEPRKVQGGTLMREEVIDDEAIYRKWKQLKGGD